MLRWSWMLFCLMAGSAYPQASLKIYVEGLDAPTAVRLLRERCPICSLVAKKESADFILSFSSPKEGATERQFALFENRNGSLIKDGAVNTGAEAIGVSLEAIREHAEKTPAMPASVSRSGNGKVYVYRYKQYLGGALEPSVYCNENELARMDNGRFFAVALPPGKHTFRSNDRQSAVELDVEPGKDYYLRVDIAQGFMKGHGRLTLIEESQGVTEVKRLRPLGQDKVRDHTAVMDEPGPQPE